MGLFSLARFVTPNAAVAVSEAVGDLATTAALGQAAENLDTYALRLNGSNALTSAGTIDASAASDSVGLKAPSKAGAAPTADGFLAFDTTKHQPVHGSNGVTAVVASSAQYGIGSSGGVSLTSVTSALGSDVSLNNTGLFLDVISINQGTVGTWLVTANVTLIDTAGAAGFQVKLWDGTTMIASGQVNATAASIPETMTLTGRITNPAANIRLSVRDATSTSGAAKFNQSGGGMDTVLTAVRIA